LDIVLNGDVLVIGHVVVGHCDGRVSYSKIRCLAE
jgi:F420-0:gamma-glutamyl ligase